MATPEPTAPYQVVVSAFVQQRLRKLHEEARRRGDGVAFVAAVREFLSRLAVYPQFGDPQIDLTAAPGVVFQGIIRPLSMRYGVFEDRRLVFCGAPPVLLPMDRPEAASGE
jgi:hypothetical protein